MKIYKIAASAALTLAAASSIVFAGATPAGAYQLGVVTATPSTNLVQGDTVTLNISGFGTDTGPAVTLYAVECTYGIVSSKGDVSYCDNSDPTDPTQSPTVPEHVVKITNASNGSATATFTVNTGTNFLATHKGAKCDYANSCVIVVTDGKTAPTTTWAGFATISFKDTRAATKTTVKTKKTAKVGSKLTVAATTTHKAAAPTGTVKFTDNGKKCGSPVKEKASGKVSGKCKVVKGKNSIVATYSGDSNYKTSKGTAKVTGKK